MAVGMSVDLDRGLRIIVFSDNVTATDLDFVGRLHNDRDHYRFIDREIVYFAPDVSLAEIEAEDIGSLADSYFEALRTRDDAVPDQSIWVMPDHVRSDARLWREFTYDSGKINRSREYLESMQAALAAYGMPADWLDDIRQGKGFRHFGQVSPLACVAPVS
jgi:hypothetical protein